MERHNRERSTTDPHLLVEDDGGGGGDFGFGGFDYGGMGYGMYAVGTNRGLYEIFVKPFVEVIQTTSGATKETMRSLISTVEVALDVLLTTFIPFIGDTYAEIFEEEERDIEAIRDKYADIYASNVEMFSHGDMNVLAFGYDPVSYVSAVFAKKSPKVASKMVELITGDDSRIASYVEKIKNIYTFSDERSKKGARRRHAEGREMCAASLLVEEKKKTRDQLAREIFVQMMNDPGVIDAIEDSRIVRSMQSDAKKAITKVYVAAKKGAEEIDGVKSFEDLKHFVGSKGGQRAARALKSIERLPNEQRAQIVPKFVQQVKKMYKGTFASGLANQLAAAKKLGMRDESDLVTTLRKATKMVASV